MTQRELLTETVKKELENLPDLLKNMEPKDRIQALLKLLPFVLPKADQEPEHTPWEI